MLNYKYLILFLGFLLLSISACKNTNTPSKVIDKKPIKKQISELDEIKKRGKIVAITNYNSTDYFLYRGEPLGFQYELLQALSKYLDVRLEIIVTNDLEKTFVALQNGECDLVAINLTITKERSKTLSFTNSHSQTRQILVQRKPENIQNLTAEQIDNKMLRNQLELAGKEVWVQNKSSFAARLHNLSDEIGDSIHIVETNEYEVDELIEKVSTGEINYTVCDENVGLVNKSYYPNIDINTAISFPQNLAWAVRKNSDELLTEINTWIENYKKTWEYAIIYSKYFKNPRSKTMITSDYHSLNSDKISDYDDIFKEYSKEIGWDWKIIASLSYQESRFDPEAKSWVGAFGLMQLMPKTAARYGVNSFSPPKLQIRAGIKLLKWLDKQLTQHIEDDYERRKFVLASYNVGLGHILDARRLAEKNDKNPNLWENNVDFYLLNKSKPKYFNDPVVKHGYCRGEEPYNFVAEILERYEHYKNLIPN